MASFYIYDKVLWFMELFKVDNMFEGFIPGSRASFILDFIGLAMIILLTLLAISIYKVRVQKAYETHKKFQITISTILLFAVLLFEIDMKVYGWKHLAEPSPYYDSWVFPALFVHIFFSVMALITWAMLIFNGLRRFPNPLKAPGPNGGYHRKLGRLGAFAMFATVFTGAIFYWLAFVAS